LGREGNPMSSLAERLEAAAPKKKPNLTEWLASLEPADRALVESAAREWSMHALENFIRKEGVAVSDVSLAKWVDSL
jgi:hypothetical protein